MITVALNRSAEKIHILINKLDLDMNSLTVNKLNIF